MGDSPAYVQATNVMSAIAAAGNIILFGAQIPLVYRMHTVDRDASKYDPLPSYTLLACMSLWSGYAVWVLPTTQLFIANFSGVVLPLAYLFFFALHSRGWARVRIIGTTLAIEAVTWLICWGVYARSGRADATTIGGAITAAFNSLFFIAPLNKLREALVTRDLSRVPVALSAVQFFQGMAWIVAASLLRDNFIMGVNSAGWGMACIQLMVIGYIKYRGPLPVAAAKAESLVVEVDGAAAEGAAAAADDAKGEAAVEADSGKVASS